MPAACRPCGRYCHRNSWAKEFELKGMNIRADEGQRIQFTLTDYRRPYLDQMDENKRLAEEVAALKGQLDAMQGKDRPRPPRPPLN
jgi:hypothetical protein